MASLAGATDVYGAGYLKNLFVSFMSGNTTMLGVALGTGDWSRAGLVASLLGLFVGGAAAGAALGTLSGRWHAPAVSCAVALGLAVPLLWPGGAVPVFTAAMGALNGAMNRVGQASIGLTYVTGTLVKFGQGIGNTLCGKPNGWSWLWQAPMWLSLLAGAVAATVLRHTLGSDVIWPLPCYALVVSAAAAFASGSEGASPGVAEPAENKVDVPRLSGKAFAQQDAVRSNCAGLM